MKRFTLVSALLFAHLAHGLPVYNLQADSLVQQVARGLKPNDPPAALRAAWTSTFMLLFASANGDVVVGSAFVVDRRVNGREQTLDLLTADHVLGTNCTARTCADLQIFAEGSITVESPTDWAMDATELPAPRVRVLSRDAGADLALIRITTSANLDVTPLTFAGEDVRPGERVYAVGFPQTYLRKDVTDVPDANVIQRRWSYGDVMGEVDYQRLAGKYVATTADALPGNSGGPLLNARGEVVGVIGMTGSRKLTGFNYIAARTGPSRGIQGSAIDLARVVAFLDRLPSDVATN